jgi:ATP-dependent Zn protease
VRAEVDRLVRGALDAARELLAGHRDELEQVVDLLLEQETVDKAELLALVPVAPAA